MIYLFLRRQSCLKNDFFAYLRYSEIKEKIT